MKPGTRNFTYDGSPHWRIEGLHNTSLASEFKGQLRWQAAALGRRRGMLQRLVLHASGAYEPDVPLRFDLRPLAQARPSSLPATRTHVTATHGPCRAEMIKGMCCKAGGGAGAETGLHEYRHR